MFMFEILPIDKVGFLMLNIPSPVDVLVSTMVWVGVPALVLLPLVIVWSIVEWFHLGSQASNVVQRASHELKKFSGEKLGRFAFRLFFLVTIQAFFIATVYSFFRLISAMGIKDINGISIADGRTFAWADLWVSLVTYTNDDQLAVNSALLALGWVLAVNVTAMFGIKIAFKTLTIVRWPIGVFSIFGAILTGVVGLMVFSLATWMNTPGYSVEMVSLYACWVIILVLIAFTISASVDRAEQVFGHGLSRRRG